MSIVFVAPALRLAGLAAILGAVASLAGAHESRQALQEDLRAYILDNPGVIVESLRRYQAEQEAVAAAERVAGRRAFLAEHGTDVYDDGYSVVLGNPDGDLTLVEFFDYRCGYCRRALGEVLALLGEDQGIRLVLKEFPILGEESVVAARMSIAASLQDQGEQFLNLHFAMLMDEGPLTVDRIAELAGEAGFDTERMRVDMEDPAIQARIDQNYWVASQLAIQGTPAFVLGDEVAPGFLTGEELLDWARRIRADS